MQVVACDNHDLAYLRLSSGHWQVWLTDALGRCHQIVTSDPVDKTRVSWSKERARLLVNDNEGGLSWCTLQGDCHALEIPATVMLDAAVSPDGTDVAFSRNSTQTWDNNDPWLLNTGKSSLKKITAMPGVEQRPAWHRDGNRLVFSSGSRKTGYHVWQYDLGSQAIEQLSSGKFNQLDPVYGPNNGVLYSANPDGDYDIWWTDGKTLSPIKRIPGYDAQPSWSDRFKRIAFFHMQGGEKAIYTMDIHGGQLNKLTADDIQARSPAWLN